MASGAPRSTAQPGAKAATKAFSASASTPAAPSDTTCPIWISSKGAGTRANPYSVREKRREDDDRAPPAKSSLALRGPFALGAKARHIAAQLGGASKRRR